MRLILKGVIRKLVYFTVSKKIWALPEKNDVLVYDYAGSKIISLYFNRRCEILHTRNESINLPILIKSFFRRGEWVREYVYCYIEYVNPKIIVTNIDNNRSFYLISSRFNNITTIFLQNGLRAFHLDVFEKLESEKGNLHNYKVDCMFTFGYSISLEYKKYIRGEFFNIGSVKNNSIKKSLSKKKRGSLLFISQFREETSLIVGGQRMSRETYFESSDKFVLFFLLEYSSLFNKDLRIMTYNAKDSGVKIESEMNYYNNLLKSEMSYIIRTSDESSYHACDEADVVIGIDSTLAYESACRGNKTAFFSIRGHFTKLDGLTFGWPSARAMSGRFWSSVANVEIFREILDHLFQIDEIQWIDLLKESNFNDLMSYDPDNIIFTKKIQSLLN